MNVGGVNAQVGTTYTVQNSDNFQCISCNNASAITLTLPNNLPVGWNALIYQKGAGQVTMSTATGATMLNRSSYTKTAGQYATVSLFVVENTGTAAIYLLMGDAA